MRREAELPGGGSPAVLAAWAALILCAPCSAALFSDVTATHVPPAPDLHSMDAEFGDFDKDGDPDAVIAVEGGTNRLYLNDGSGRLAWKQGVFSSRAGDSEDAAVADFDGDGDLDVILVEEDGGTHQFYLGDGAAAFRDVSDRLPGCEANGVEAADVSGDGWTDVIIGCAGRDLLLVNDRKGGFRDETSARLPALAESTQDVKLADLDGDGDLDLVCGNDSGRNRLLVNRGQGFFDDSSANLPVPYPEETREVLLFDADNDRDNDIVFCNLTCNACGTFTRNPQVRLLLNDGKGRFSDATLARMPPNTFSSWDGGYLDFDADGDLDLVICAIEVPGFKALAYKAYRNESGGFFRDATAEVFPAGIAGWGWDVEVADLDRDGALDLFLCSRPGQNLLVRGLVKQPAGLKVRPGRDRRQGAGPRLPVLGPDGRLLPSPAFSWEARPRLLDGSLLPALLTPPAPKSIKVNR